MQFSEVIGQKALKSSLIQSINEGRISHALLFVGPEGNGALPLALAYVQYLFCTKRSETDSCGTCRECVQIAKLAHPDVHFVYPLSLTKSSVKEGAEGRSPGVSRSADVYPRWREAFLQNPYLSLTDWMDFLEMENKQMVIGVEEAKDILHKLSLTSFEGSYKVMIIWMADKMNLQTANKMLKILEEPPGKTIFILITENSQLPATVLSRMQVIKTPRIHEPEMAAALAKIHGLTGEAALHLAQASEGNYRLARLLVAETEHSEFHAQKFQEWMRICVKLNAEKINAWVAEIGAIGRERQKLFLSYSIKSIRQTLLMGVEFPVRAGRDEEEFLKKFSSFLPFDHAALIAEEMNRGYHAIERNANPKILLMSLSMNIHRLMN